MKVEYVGPESTFVPFTLKLTFESYDEVLATYSIFLTAQETLLRDRLFPPDTPSNISSGDFNRVCGENLEALFAYLETDDSDTSWVEVGPHKKGAKTK